MEAVSRAKANSIQKASEGGKVRLVWLHLCCSLDFLSTESGDLRDLIRHDVQYSASWAGGK